MRELFPGYYRPTPDEFDILWSRGEIVLDTNVLLNLYRYGERARSSWLEVLVRARERLWLPHQVALEFQANRVAVIADQRRRYEDVRKLAEEIRGQMESVFKGLSRHPTLSIDRMSSFIDDGLAKLVAYVDDVEQSHTEFTRTDELVASDPIRTELDRILTGKIGIADANDIAASRQGEAVRRLENKIPPGFRDIGKKGDVENATGDALLWLQLLEHAEEVEAPIILVTDERGEDWWWKSRGRTLGPRPELTAEIRDRAGVLFYLYSPDKFLRWAIDRFSIAVDDLDATAEETKQVGEWVRAKEALERAESLAAHLAHLRLESDAADSHENQLQVELYEAEQEVQRYLNLSDELANSPIGDKADMRRWSTETRRDRIRQELDVVRARREALHQELTRLEHELAHARSTVRIRDELDY